MWRGTTDPTNLFPLSADEAHTFGWGCPDGTHHPVFACRGPSGQRLIPTRQLNEDGGFSYGFIETMEPPTNTSDDLWQIQFGVTDGDDTPRCAMM